MVEEPGSGLTRRLSIDVGRQNPSDVVGTYSVMIQRDGQSLRALTSEGGLMCGPDVPNRLRQCRSWAESGGLAADENKNECEE
jgi:hypothetical protein